MFSGTDELRIIIIFIIIGRDVGNFTFDGIFWFRKGNYEDSENYDKHRNSNSGEYGAFGGAENFAVTSFGAREMRGFGITARVVKASAGLFVFIAHGLILP